MGGFISAVLVFFTKGPTYYKYFGILYKLAKSVVVTIEEEYPDGSGPEKLAKADEWLKEFITKLDELEESFEDLQPIWHTAVTAAVSMYNVLGRFQHKNEG